MKRAALLTVVLGLVYCGQAAAENMKACTDEANRTRYAEEVPCYESYGPQSGNWSTRDTSELDACLQDVRSAFSAEVEVCSELYVVEPDPINWHRYTTGALISTAIIWLLL